MFPTSLFGLVLLLATVPLRLVVLILLEVVGLTRFEAETFVGVVLVGFTDVIFLSLLLFPILFLFVELLVAFGRISFLLVGLTTVCELPLLPETLFPVPPALTEATARALDRSFLAIPLPSLLPRPVRLP